jgi:cAMP phosphodiesterase
VKLKLLPSSFEPDGAASQRQHLTCFLINGKVAVDAGSLAMAVTDEERASVRDIVITHAHLDHIAGLPLFLDDQFSELTEPVRIHATAEVVRVLERDVFNWSVYPRFSELENDHGKVMVYRPFEQGTTFNIGDLQFRPLEVNHKVPCSGFVISDGTASIAITGDTANMEDFWAAVADIELSALMIECAFPNELSELADMSRHLTPITLAAELKKFQKPDCEIFVVNIKPSYRARVLSQIAGVGLTNVKAMEIGTTYDWGKGLFHQVS